MKQPWKRITETRSKDGRPAGLTYHYPCCETAFFLPLSEIEAFVAGTFGSLNPVPEMCPNCPEEGNQ